MGAGASLLFGPAAASNLTSSSLSPAANKLSKRLAKQIAKDRLKQHEDDFDPAADADEEEEAVYDEDIKKVFNRFDADGGGFLDKEEFTACCAAMALGLSEEETNKHFVEIDASGDGLIQTDEFVLFMHAQMSASSTAKAEILNACMVIADAADKAAEAAEAAAAPEAEEQDGPADEELPDGWVKALDESSGHFYYAHPESGRSSWQKPRANPFGFTTGLMDCASTNPEMYKVKGKIPGARLIEMTATPGAADKAHDHPQHALYVVKGGKLDVREVTEDGRVCEEEHVVNFPSGAPMAFPAGPRQVTNVGDTDVKLIFIEPYPDYQPCGKLKGFTAPFDTNPECYEVLAEDDDWITGKLEMAPGAEDALHHHKDHILYVLEGDEIAIFPADGSECHAVQLKAGDCLPAPMAAANRLFAEHRKKNTGKKKAVLVFFEKKR